MTSSGCRLFRFKLIILDPTFIFAVTRVLYSSLQPTLFGLLSYQVQTDIDSDDLSYCMLTLYQSFVKGSLSIHVNVADFPL